MKRTITKDRLYYFFVISFWLILFVAPRVFENDLSAGMLSKVRLEDFLIPVWLFYLFSNRGLKNIIGPKLTFLIPAWLLFIIVFTCVNCLLLPYPLLLGGVFVGKEAEYLIIFSFFALFAARNPKFAILSFFTATVPVFIYSLGQMISGTYRGFYGLSLPFEDNPRSSSEVGAISAVIALSFFVLWLNKNDIREHLNKLAKPFLYGATVLAFLITTLTISRSNIIALFSAAVILVVINIFRKRIKSIFLGYIALFILTYKFVIEKLPLFEQILDRFYRTSIAFDTRLDRWAEILQFQVSGTHGNSFSLITGLGLGSPSPVVPFRETASVTLGMDSQYIRRLFETGVIGSIIWYLVLIYIAVRIVHNVSGSKYRFLFFDLVVGVYALILISSCGMETLQVIRIASVFYALIGTLLGVSCFIAASEHKLENSAAINSTTL